MKRTGGGLGTVVVVALVVLYFTGRLDPLLYKVGLNYKPCGQNAFGGVYCGKALTEYNERVERAHRELGGALTKYELEAQRAQQQSQAEALKAEECVRFRIGC